KWSPTLTSSPNGPMRSTCAARPAGQKAGEHLSPRNFGSTEMLIPTVYDCAGSPKLNEVGHADRSTKQNAKRRRAEGAALRAHRAARSAELPLYSDGLQRECDHDHQGRRRGAALAHGSGFAAPR